MEICFAGWKIQHVERVERERKSRAKSGVEFGVRSVWMTCGNLSCWVEESTCGVSGEG